MTSFGACRSIPPFLVFHRGRYGLLAVVWILLGIFVVIPALHATGAAFWVGERFSFGHFRDFFSLRMNGSSSAGWDWWTGGHGLSPGLQALYGSLLVSVLSMLGAAALGVPLAFLLEKREFPGRGILSGLMLLPLTLPPIVGVVAFELLLSEAGILPRGLAWIFNLDAPPLYLEGRGGVIAVHAYSFFPFFLLLVSEALREMDTSLLEASRGLGMGSWRTFLLVELPMLRPALFGGAVMVFMLSMASFSAPLLLDVEGMYLSTHIYNLKSQNLWGEACTVTTVFMAASLISLLLLRKLRGFRRYVSAGKGTPARRGLVATQGSRWIAAMIGWGILLVLVLPHLGILLWSLTRDGTWTYQILPPEWTLENYARIFGADSHSSDILRPIANSFWMAALATVANILFGLAAAYVLKSRRLRGNAGTELLVMLPWALPGTVIAVNLLATWNHPSALSFGMNLANSVWLLPMAYFIRNIPLVVRPIAAAWERQGEELEEAARVLGSGRLRSMRTVSLPLVLPSIISGGLLAFVTALGEFIASAVLFTPANKPISLALFGEFHAGAYAQCSAYGVLLMLFIAVVMMVGGRSARSAGV